jgi:hypothetical protein
MAQPQAIHMPANFSALFFAPILFSSLTNEPSVYVCSLLFVRCLFCVLVVYLGVEITLLCFEALQWCIAMICGLEAVPSTSSLRCCVKSRTLPPALFTQYKLVLCWVPLQLMT